MGLLVAIAAIVGFVLGIQTPIEFGFLLLAILVVCIPGALKGEKAIVNIIPVCLAGILLIGMLVGDIYVHFNYPEQSELAPFIGSGIPNPFVPPGAD